MTRSEYCNIIIGRLYLSWRYYNSERAYSELFFSLNYIFVISTADHGYYPRCVNDPSLVSSRRSVGRRCNPDRKIPVMNGERRPRPRRLSQYTSYTYIVLYYYYYILYTLTYHTRWWRGDGATGKTTFPRMTGRRRKKGSPLYDDEMDVFQNTGD